MRAVEDILYLLETRLIRNKNNSKSDKKLRSQILRKIVNIYDTDTLYELLEENHSKVVNVYFCNNLIKVLSNNFKFSDQAVLWNLIKGVFKLVVDCKSADEFTFSMFITAAGNHRRFKDAKEAFEEAKRKELTDKFTFSSFITAVGNSVGFEEIEEAFEEAKEKGLANIITYNSFITAAGNNGRFEEANKTFKEAIERKLADIVTYNSFITAAGNNGRFEEAKKAFKKAKKKRLANIVTYSCFMTISGNNGRFKEAKKAFKQAINEKLNNIIMYSSFITAAGNNGKFKEAKKAFKKAKKKRLVNIVTYSCFITAAGNNGRFKEAKKAFEEAKKKGLADTVTYNSFILAAGNDGEFTEATNAFEQAEKEKLVGLPIYNVLIDVALLSGKTQSVRKIFKKEIWKKYFKDKTTIDLHGHSFGTALLTLKKIKKIYKRKDENDKVSIIAGSGTHTRRSDSVVLIVIEKLKEKFPVSVRQSIINDGRYDFFPNKVDPDFFENLCSEVIKEVKKIRGGIEGQSSQKVENSPDYRIEYLKRGTAKRKPTAFDQSYLEESSENLPSTIITACTTAKIAKRHRK